MFKSAADKVEIAGDQAATIPVPSRRDTSMTALRLLRRRTLVRSLHGRINASRWQIFMALVSSAVMWCMLLWACHAGFVFMTSVRWFSGYLIELLFGLFFSTLWIMLIFSTGILLYAGLFSSDQSRSMLVRPIPPDQIFAYKFEEALLFSSWGFLVLGSPLILSYGWTVDAPWTYYLFGAAYFLGFSLLAGSVGGLACLGLTLFVPRNKKQIVAFGLAILIGGITWNMVRAWRGVRGGLNETSVVQFLQDLRVSRLPLLPSHWMSKGIRTASLEDHATEAFLFLMVVMSNALLAYLLAAAAHRSFYRRAYDRVHSQRFARRAGRSVRSVGFLDRVLRFLPNDLRALTVKDVRTFLRNPLQLLQLLILTSLLSLYIISLGTIHAYSDSPYLRTMIGLLNVTVMGLFLNVFTSRFVFPLLSLEGRRMWILGLCPVSRDAILWSKFLLAAAGSSLLLLGMTVLSAWMLQLSAVATALQLLLVPVLSCGVSGIAVGLGARFADPTETDPSKIAAGVGGTINLIVSLVFIVCALGTIALPSHIYALDRAADMPGMNQQTRIALADATPVIGGVVSWFDPLTWVAVGSLLSCLVGLVATWLPMRIGSRAFRAMEV
ncbi:MAG: hypothetical protein ACC645_01030 [Pirellulales bacterium]